MLPVCHQARRVQWAQRAARAAPALALAVTTLLTYGNSLGNGYVWDDEIVVVDNPDNRELPGVARVWTSADLLAKSQPAPYYRPINRLSYVLDGHLFRQHPFPAHLENLLLHLAAGLALLSLGRRLFGSTPGAFVAALLFSVHPINAEPVNFITARNNLFAAVFVLSACLVYVRARDSGRRALLFPAAVLLLLGLLSKETAFMLLPFLAVHELVAGPASRAKIRASILNLAPLALAAVAYLGARAWVLPSVVGQPLDPGEIAAALSQNLRIIPKYLSLLILPRDLTIHYALPATYFAGAAALAAAWIGIGFALVGLLWQGRPVTRFGLLWFAVHFIPVSGVVPIPSAPLADRFMYLPAIGLFLVAADQVEALRRRRALRTIGWAVVAVVASCLAARTVVRNRDWKDNLALFGSAARLDPSCADAAYNLGIALEDAGDFEGARREWERAVRVDARNVGALSRLGTWHAARGNLDRALGYFREVLVVQPRDVETRFNMALLMEQMGRPREALRFYEEFLALDPADYPALLPRVRERVARLTERP